MMPFDKCPICGGEMVNKKVEKILRGGNDTAVVQVEAEVCLHCGERLYSPDVIQRFEQIRYKLTHHQTKEFTAMGQAFLAG
ncbi:MAG: YgiT-type zinc finger protein [bacterium]|nr:YgiT-type zinc finger protein [bacterium]